MKRRAVLTAAAAAVVATAAHHVRAADARPADARADARPEAELKALLDVTAKEWTSGDIDGFCSHYHPDAVFVSPSGLTKTRQAVLDRYKKKYATKEAMGTLTFEVLDILAGADAASIAMKWKLSYEKKPAAEGFSVIGLVAVPGSPSPSGAARAWQIKHDASM